MNRELWYNGQNLTISTYTCSSTIGLQGTSTNKHCVVTVTQSLGACSATGAATQIFSFSTEIYTLVQAVSVLVLWYILHGYIVVSVFTILHR